MRTKLLPDAILDVVKRNRHAYQAGRRVRMAIGRVVPPRRFPDLPGRVHFNDFMLEDDSPAGRAKYRAEAMNVVDLIERALAEDGRTWEDVESWLDFGCGYGRVLRFLVERVPPERVWASDVIREGVDFCAEEFGVHGLHSADEIGALRLGRYDFVYAISVATHVTEENSTALLRLLGESLRPGGLLLFTTHGQWSLDHIEFYGSRWVPQQAEIARRVRERGIAYEPYGYYADDNYGLTWHSERRVRETMAELHGDALDLVFFEPHGLDHHQDVFVYRRRR
jgi:SAM-dependent methyltransferase